MSRWMIVLVGCSSLTNWAFGADARDALALRPVQKDVDYEIPAAADIDKCKLGQQRQGKSFTFLLTGANGQVLRQFLDTNGDGKLDQWRYFQNGIEVYRDIDSNFNDKVDQVRWLNFGGSRWGMDANEDGKIDSWKSISAAEASREAINAIISGDEAVLNRVLLSPQEIKSLGLNADLHDKLTQSVQEAPRKSMEVARKSRTFGPGSKWIRFDALMPSAIPADSGVAKQDLVVYENAMCIVEAQGKSYLVQVGEIVQVGDTWKLTQAPIPIDDSGKEGVVISGGLLIQPMLASSSSSASEDAPSAEIQKILLALQELDKSAPKPDARREALVKYNRDRVALMEQLVGASKTDDERAQWMKQMIDGIALSVQTGTFPEGLEQIRKLETEIGKGSLKKTLMSYVVYRRLNSEYYVATQENNTEKRQEAMKSWLKSLESFVEKYGTSDDAADAMLQLAVNEEFMGRIPEAEVWYQRLVKEKPDSPATPQANGALRRLLLNGKPLALSGPGLNGAKVDVAAYRGKVVLVMYWTTWCTPCLQELPQFRALYKQYQPKGFEILGVNIDSTKEPVLQYIRENQVAWQQIHEPGSFQSPVAVAYGVITVPTMFLVGKDGRVVSRSTSLEEVKSMLPDLLK